jgi:hypothetical protein
MQKVTFEKVKRACESRGITVTSYEEGATLLQTEFPKVWEKRLERGAQRPAAPNGAKYIFYRAGNPIERATIQLMEELGETLYAGGQSGSPGDAYLPYASALVLSILDETEDGEDV